MVLVLGIAARLPGLGALGHTNAVLGGGAGGVAAEMPAGEGEGAGHDGEEGLRSIVSELNASVKGTFERHARRVRGRGGRLCGGHSAALPP